MMRGREGYFREPGLGSWEMANILSIGLLPGARKRQFDGIGIGIRIGIQQFLILGSWEMANIITDTGIREMDTSTGSGNTTYYIYVD